LSPASQNLVLCRAVAERLRAEGLTDTRVAFAAYRDTLRPLVEPSEIPPGLFVRYAPRERSYGAPLDCQESERNRWYATNLEKWRSLLDSGSLGVTEYYTDCV